MGLKAFNQKHPVICTFLWSVVSAFVVLMICSRSSFLYPFNIWDDVNSYFTMGKSMMRGVVPYRDLFDQKGILLYFLYGIGYLMSHTTFAGVFVLEVLAGGLCIMAMILLMALFATPPTRQAEEKPAAGNAIVFGLAPVLFALMCVSRSFYWGGSAEEFLSPALLWGMYLLARYFARTFSRALPKRTVFAGGVLAGVVFHIKFNSIGFFLGWALMVLVAELVRPRGEGSGRAAERVKRVAVQALVFLAGMAAVTAPFAVYFGLHGAIDDWVRVYLYDNLFLYSDSLTFAERFVRMGKVMAGHVMTNLPFMLPVAIGFVLGLVMVLRTRTKRAVLLYASAVVTMAGLATVIFIGGKDLPYYPYPLSVYVAVFGVVCVKGTERVTVPVPLTHLFSLALAAALSFFLSMNTPDIGMKKEDLWLFRMKAVVDASGIEDVKLINLNCFDAGLYTVTDSVPECYYFQTQTIPIEGIWETQKDYVKSGAPDFCLIRGTVMDFNYGPYVVVAEEGQSLAGHDYYFLLYQKMEKSGK